jgi:small subunit ribosomal protein S4
MARYTGPKFKLSRREGVNVTGTTSARLENVINLPPGGRPRPRKETGYGLRLRAKQRVKEQYGILERALRRFFGSAQRMPGPTGFNLLRLLELRLDNVVYRLALARTRPMAQQVVSHRHVFVNGKLVNVPSYLVSPGDLVTVTPVPGDETISRRVTASWLERNGARGRVTGLPRREDIEADIREDRIVEFFAR